MPGPAARKSRTCITVRAVRAAPPPKIRQNPAAPASCLGRLEPAGLRLGAAGRGEGQAIGIVGEAGIGKSRLLFELRQSVADRPVRFLEGHRVSYGVAIPYGPVLDLLRESCGIADVDTPEAIAAKLAAGLRAAGLEPEDGAPYLLRLLGVKAGTDRIRGLAPESYRIAKALRSPYCYTDAQGVEIREYLLVGYEGPGGI